MARAGRPGAILEARALYLWNSRTDSWWMDGRALAAEGHRQRLRLAPLAYPLGLSLEALAAFVRKGDPALAFAIFAAGPFAAPSAPGGAAAVRADAIAPALRLVGLALARGPALQAQVAQLSARLEQQQAAASSRA